MALAVRNFASASIVAPAVLLTINKPAGTVTGDIMVASLSLRTSSANAAIVVPTGWFLVQSRVGTNVATYQYVKYATSAEPASYNFYIVPSVEACGSIDSYFSTAFGRIVLKNTGVNASGTNHTIPSLNNTNVNVTGAITHVALGGGGNNTWTAPGSPAYVKQSDLASSASGTAVSLATGRLAVAGSGELAGGVWTSSGAVDSAVCALTLFEGGVTQPSGYRNTIFLYDDLQSKDTTGYGIDEINTGFPADIELKDLAPENYSGHVSIQLGDSGTGAATTTLKDKSLNLRFDSGKTFLWRSTQTSSWWFVLGTKIAGSFPSGKEGCTIWLGAATTIRGNTGGYGSTIRSTAGAINIFSQAAGGLTAEWYNSIIEGTLQISFGNSSQGRIEDCFNVDFQSTTTGAVLSNFFTGQARKITVSATNPSSFIQTGAAINVKDIIFNGSPTGSGDVVNTGGSVWNFVRPIWSKNTRPVGVTTVNILEWWLANWSTRDGLTGAVVPGITLRLVDTFDMSTLCSGATDSTGSFVFGTADIFQNGVVVAFYDTTTNQILRGPYILYVNVDAPVNPAYASTALWFVWPYDGTWTFGGQTFRIFRDVDDVLPMFAPVVVGPPVNTQKIYYPGLPAELPGVERIPLTLPKVA